MPKFSQVDFRNMLDARAAAVSAVETVTGKPAHLSGATVFVKRAAFAWTFRDGRPGTVSALPYWKVPAPKYWPGEKLPASLSIIMPVPLKHSDFSSFNAFMAETRAAGEAKGAKAAREKEDAAESARVADWQENSEKYLAKGANSREEYQAIMQAEQRTEWSKQAARRRREEDEAKAARKDEQAAKRKAGKAKAAKVAPPAVASPEIAETPAEQAERPETAIIIPFPESATMKITAADAAIAGRVIPPNSTVMHGPAGTVYLYELAYETRKGRKGTTFYVKAFAAGARKHAWHKSFNSQADREAAVAPFLAGEAGEAAA